MKKNEATWSIDPISNTKLEIQVCDASATESF